MVTPESKIKARFLREQWLFKDGNGEIVVLLSQMHKGNINKDNIDGVNMKSFPIKEVISNEKNGGRGDAAAAADKRGRTPERPGNGTDAADRARGSGGNGEVGDIRRDVGISDGGRTDGGCVAEAERILLISKKEQGYCGAP